MPVNSAVTLVQSVGYGRSDSSWLVDLTPSVGIWSHQLVWWIWSYQNLVTLGSHQWKTTQENT